MVADSLHETAGLASDVIDDNRDDRPPEVLDLGPAGLVPQHFHSSGVPVDAVVFGGQAQVGPGEVHSPQLAIGTVDQILQLRTRQPAINHDQPGLTFHGRLRAWVGKWQEFAYRNDPAPAVLLGNRGFDLIASALH